jgi:hypothetical protein
LNGHAVLGNLGTARPASTARRVLLATLLGALSLPCPGCNETARPLNPGEGASRQVVDIVSANAPSRLTVRNGVLFWADADFVPLKALVLAAGTTTPLFTPLGVPESLVLDGQNLYWIGGGRLYRTSIDGASTVVIDSASRDPVSGVTPAIAVDGTSVYWVTTIYDAGCSIACRFTIRRVPKSGGAPAVLVSTYFERISGLAVAGGQLYWEENENYPVAADGSGGSAIWTIPVGGGTATMVVDGCLNGLYCVAPAQGSWIAVGGIRTDGSDIYFAASDPSGYRVLKVPAMGGPVSVMASVRLGFENTGAADIELDGTTVYWGDINSVRAVPKAGGAVSTLSATQDPVVYLAYTDGRLYWVESPGFRAGAGRIRTMPASGGAATTVITEVLSGVAITADPSFVFWAEGGEWGREEGFGRIARVTADGASLVVLAESAQPSASAPFDVDDSTLFFVDQWNIKKVPSRGGRVERLAFGGMVLDVVTDGVYVFWSMLGDIVARVSIQSGAVLPLYTAGPQRTGHAASRMTPQPQLGPAAGWGWGPEGRIRLGSTHVYWLDVYGTIWRVSKDSGSLEIVIPHSSAGATDFVIAGEYVVYSEWDGGRIRRTSLTGSDTTTLVALNPDQTRRLATDGTSLYWIDQSHIGKVRISGGLPETIEGRIAADAYVAEGIAVDSTSLYWTESDANLIRRAKPK